MACLVCLRLAASLVRPDKCQRQQTQRLAAKQAGRLAERGHATNKSNVLAVQHRMAIKL